VLELEETHVFRNYSTGEPSSRLYVKNLARQVEDKVGVVPIRWGSGSPRIFFLSGVF